MEPLTFYSEKAVYKYMLDKKRRRMKFYFNVWGWTTYLTLEPTGSTPTGKHPDFPRTKTVTLPKNINAIC